MQELERVWFADAPVFIPESTMPLSQSQTSRGALVVVSDAREARIALAATENAGASLELEPSRNQWHGLSSSSRHVSAGLASGHQSLRSLDWYHPQNLEAMAA